MLTLPVLLAFVGSFSGGPTSNAPGSSPAVAHALRAAQYLWSAAENQSVELAPEGALFDWRARVDPDGVRFESGVAWTKTPGERAWVRVRTTAFGRVDDARPVGSGTVERDGARASIVRPGIVEWFEGRSDGVEQGWTIAAPPAGERNSAVWIGLEFEGLAPQIAEDGKSAKLVDDRAVERFSYRNLVAHDASGKELDARLSVTSLGVGVRFDDASASYPIEIDPVISGVAWVFEPNQAGADCGYANTAGDVNGDGYSDFVVSAWAFDGPGGANTGAAWCFHGGPSGLGSSSTPNWTSYGPNQPGAGFGSWVSGLGDLNGDGFDDVAVGAPAFSGPETNEGAVYVYLGSSAGLTTTPFWTIEGNQASAYFAKVFYAGDLNGDGQAELAICTQTDGTPGFARVYAGSSNPTPGAPIWTMNAAGLAAYGVTPNTFDHQRLTPTVAGAGDVNADGFDDLLLSCFHSMPGTIGRAFVFLGSATGPSTTPVWAVNGPGAIQSFGFLCRPAGDINGDGYADVVITDWQYPTGLPNAPGAAVVYLANPTANPTTILPTNPSQIITSSQPAAELGWNAGAYCAGDIDGDGFADLFLGGAYGNGQTGHVELFRGSSSNPPFAATADITILGGQAGGLFGWSTGTAGDVNGDGRSDVYATYLRVDNPEVDEGAVHVYYGQQSGAPLLPPPAGQTPTLNGTAGSSFATSLSSAGDVNGDGFSDLLVGAPDYDAGFTDQGRVLLYLGTATGLDSIPVWTFTSGVNGARLGASVSYAGDVNNDGYTDVLIGAPRLTNGQFQEGRAYLFLGNATATLGSTPSWTFEPNASVEKLGESVAGAGDVNGDGYADVAIGAPGATVLGVPSSGSVYVFLGSATGLGASWSARLDNPLLGDARFGAAVANAGDLNFDGQTELVVGAPDTSNPEFHEGRAYVYLGSSAGLVTAPAFTVESNVANALLGGAVSAAGDVDADGFADVLVGVPDLAGGGQVRLYRGQSGAVPVVASPQLFNGTQNGARLGASLCRAGDVNADGYSDVVFAAPNHNTNQGEVYVHLGVSSGLATSPALTFPGAAGANLGAGLGGCGDIDGDGFTDVVLGQPGQSSGAGGAVIYVGGTQYGPVRRSQQRRASAADAIDLLCLTDSTNLMRLQGGPNNFGNVRSTPAGRTRVALEWEMKSGSSLLDGTALARGTFQDVGSPTAPATLTETVSGLNSSQRYQWRQRIATTNPLFPHGLWASIQGNGKHEKKFGTGFDCNNNGIPDSTEVAQNPALDCDDNGGIDACQIAIDPTLDCDNDGILNSCELFANDCDANNYPDDCQLAQGAPDCNGNNVLDACELSPATDANGDSILDVCQFTPYCSGDGTGTACPCGNSGGAGRGCANSVNVNGAVLTVTGWPSIANDTLVLRGAGMPNSASPSAIYLQGTAQDNGGLGTPIQDGLRCVTGSLIRLGTRPNSGNQSQYPDVGNVAINIRGQLNTLPMPQTRHYQVYYRNAATAFCPPGTANWTNGFTIVWGL